MSFHATCHKRRVVMQAPLAHQSKLALAVRVYNNDRWSRVMGTPPVAHVDTRILDVGTPSASRGAVATAPGYGRCLLSSSQAVYDQLLELYTSQKLGAMCPRRGQVRHDCRPPELLAALVVIHRRIQDDEQAAKQHGLTACEGEDADAGEAEQPPQKRRQQSGKQAAAGQQSAVGKRAAAAPAVAAGTSVPIPSWVAGVFRVRHGH